MGSIENEDPENEDRRPTTKMKTHYEHNFKRLVLAWEQKDALRKRIRRFEILNSVIYYGLIQQESLVNA